MISMVSVFHVSECSIQQNCTFVCCLKGISNQIQIKVSHNQDQTIIKFSGISIHTAKTAEIAQFWIRNSLNCGLTGKLL